jgi:SAM-dependent methyltransferase
VKEKLLERLQCPNCSGRFGLQDAVIEQGEVKEGKLLCQECSGTYPIINYIPRLVDNDNYAHGFGFQWNIHARTQVDKFNGTHITRDRFYEGTRWAREDLVGQTIFEAGCGSGRFTQIMLDAGMEVYSLDYSNAVDASLANHGLHPNLHIVQGSIYDAPYAQASFDRVFCFGVMQHTPNVKHTFECLAEMVKPGGYIAVDVYAKTLKAMLHYPRYLLRPLAKRLPSETLYKLVEKAVPLLLPISIALKCLPLVGRYLFPLIPVANYKGLLPLDRDQHREWSVLDTFDWLGSWYDQPQTAETLRAWLIEGGMVECDVSRMGSYVGTGRKRDV